VFAAAGFYFSPVKASGEPVEPGDVRQIDQTFPSPVAPADEVHAFADDVENAEFELLPEEAGGEAGSQDYSRFSHTTQAHRRVSCLLCHRREDNSPRPRLPGHSSCIGCHAPQFSDPGNSRICLVCHTQIASSNLKAFPRLRSFNAKFSHVVHTRRGAAPRQGCAGCHAPVQRSVARSIPAGFSAHTTCFQCHTARGQGGGRDISSCGTCHSLGRFTPVSQTSRAYRVNFSHAGHAELSCNECHQVRNGARGNQVTETTPAMHFPPARAQSCASCHNNNRAFGGNDFSDCRRCHTGNNFNF
jgi:c(7)-type cytochrome triheme protein